MKTLSALTVRNLKLFFRDKGLFVTALITPIILLVLYTTFLQGVYEDAFTSVAEQFGITLSDEILGGCVGGQLMSSLLAVSCITVAFCSNLLMVQDRASGVRHDLDVAPVKQSTIAISYYISTLIASVIINFVAVGACFIYLAVSGWYLTAADIAWIFTDVILLVMFGTALSSIISYPLTSQGQISAVGSVISAGYGFIAGAYMPISQFPEVMQKVISFFPGTYATSLIRNHSMRSAMDAMEEAGIPDSAMNELERALDMRIDFLESAVSVPQMLITVCVTVALLLVIYILMNLNKKAS